MSTTGTTLREGLERGEFKFGSAIRFGYRSLVGGPGRAYRFIADALYCVAAHEGTGKFKVMPISFALADDILTSPTFDTYEEALQYLVLLKATT